MSETTDENEPGIPDSALPEDLVPGEDNPLAGGLEDGETVDDLLEGGKQAEQPEQPEQPAEASGESGESQPG